ncbi:EamA family transporter [Mycolicibacterium fluoranthenivorans]|uniref:EamA family transporter n=1 Tax=Mycolicibacterium fluoranthenivorans TaxID=258505 RepID=A0A7G8PHP6_9MYCO|nr:EamA family transporter [Mycolicibacterium fluoranthenivorans]QNJ93862.1 EamA family transporter [Mycolicibacterium fluoranthenivorans]
MISKPAGPVPAWTLALGAVFSVQLAAALSVDLIAAVGPAGTAWLRLTAGAVILLAVARPPLREIRRADVPGLLALGIASGLMGIAFLAAIERIPLGTAVAIEFLGPLTVAAARGHTRRALLWPATALVGVVLLTEPWSGSVDGVGVAWAIGAGIGWATYILLTQRVGDRYSGIKGLTITVPIAALTTAFVGIPQASGNLTVTIVAASVGLALMFPVLTFTLEMAALRRMTHTAFGTLMALEPAAGVLFGLVVLQQNPAIIQIVGVVLVILAGAAAQYGGSRTPPHRTKGTQPNTLS